MWKVEANKETRCEHIGGLFHTVMMIQVYKDRLDQVFCSTRVGYLKECGEITITNYP